MNSRRYQLIVTLIASLVFIGCIVSPPSLMDDVDSVQASISRTMLVTGDWVTPHLDGIKYFEKPPLKYWLIAICFRLFGVHDYVARLPLALFCVALCWLTARIGAWAFDRETGLYSGLVLSTCVGLFLFTRVLIADVALTFTITLAMWAFLRALDGKEEHPRRWGVLFWASVGTGLLFKGLIAAVFPVTSGFLFLLFTKQLLNRESWRRLAPLPGIGVFLLIAAPWHILAAIRNPPAFYISFFSGPGHYHGFFWFYFFNEHILRFLNRRYPHDYNTVPRLAFWLFHLLWLFPWSVYFPALARLNFRGGDRAAQTRIMALCWIGFLMLFFSFSSTQEYYSMPAYPAVALLLGCAMASGEAKQTRWVAMGNSILLGVAIIASGAMLFVLARVWNLPTPGDISQALTRQNPDAYTLSLGHMGDLTLQSFAYLRPPLLLAFTAFLTGATGLVILKGRRRYFAITAMMVLFFHASRLAMVTFDPYLSSKTLADAYRQSPPGELIVDNQYYAFSSVFFYAHTAALLHNGRINNLEYGSNAPDAPSVFIDDAGLTERWRQMQRYYLVVEKPALPGIEKIIGISNFVVVRESGGKYLLTNRPISLSAHVSNAYND